MWAKEYYNKSELNKRCWTPKMIGVHLGEPDLKERVWWEYKAAHFYKADRVHAAEAMAVVADKIAKCRVRRAQLNGGNSDMEFCGHPVPYLRGYTIDVAGDFLQYIDRTGEARYKVRFVATKNGNMVRAERHLGGRWKTVCENMIGKQGAPLSGCLSAIQAWERDCADVPRGRRIIPVPKLRNGTTMTAVAS